MTILAVAFAIPVAARAHDGHVHRIMGTVTARDAKHLEVKTPSGEVLSIAITGKTTALRNKKRVDLKEVQIGRRVVVDIGRPITGRRDSRRSDEPRGRVAGEPLALF